MADNVAITAGAGTTVAADEVVDATLGTVKVQYVKLMDGTLDGTAKTTVKAASTPAAATDPALVVSFAPANCATGISDGTNEAAVKAASTAPAATDPALVVAISPNTPAIPAKGEGTIGSAVPAGAAANGFRAATANPTNATGGNLVGAMADKAGRLVVSPGHVRELVGVQTTTIASSSAETTVVTAGGASVFCDISSISITNATATACNATLKDATAGTTRAIFDLAANGGIVLNFPVPMVQAAANNNWTITLSSAAVTVHINVVYLKNL